MPETEEKSDTDFDPRIQSEKIAFSSDEMIACNSCGRRNAPTRSICIYCGHELEPTRANAAAVEGRNLESWERGFNVIVPRNPVLSESQIKAIAAFLSVEPADLHAILRADAPLPIARLDTENAAGRMAAELKKHGLAPFVITDEKLDADNLPTRLSGIEIGHDAFGFIDFNSKHVKHIALTDLVLIVSGHLARSRTDVVEKRRRKGVETLEELDTESTEAVLDLYERNDSRGFRIHLTGFDFSCLGAEKGLLAGENLTRLTERLRENAPNARFVGNYSVVKPLLCAIWEVDSRTDALGKKSLGFGKSGIASVTSTSNLRQFTKFSRLQFHLV